MTKYFVSTRLDKPLAQGSSVLYAESPEEAVRKFMRGYGPHGKASAETRIVVSTDGEKWTEYQARIEYIETISVVQPDDVKAMKIEAKTNELQIAERSLKEARGRKESCLKTLAIDEELIPVLQHTAHRIRCELEELRREEP